MPFGTFDYLRAPLAGAALLGAVAAPAHAQNFDLDPIIVEGVSLGDTPVPYSETGSAVTVVTGEELERRQARTAGDALRSLPGVSVSRTGALGGVTQVRIRGAEGNQTLVLIDGIEANDTGNGEFNFSDLDISDVDRIEVIRGPQSGLYGSKAVGGVVNIITRSGSGPLQVRARTETGSFATTNSAVNVSGGSDFAWGSLSFSNQQTNGFNISYLGDETDESRLKSYAFKGGIRPFKPLTFDVVLRGSDKLAASDPEGPGAGLLPVLFDRHDFSNADVLLGSAGAKLELFGGHWVHEIRGDLNETDREFRSPTTYARNEGDSTRRKYLSTVNFETPGLARGKHTVTGLVEGETQRFNPVTQDNIERSRKVESFAGNYNGEFFDLVGVQLAARRDDFDVFGAYDTWRTAGSLRVPSTPFRVHASAGTGIKAPTMFEQFGEFPGFFVPNPNLVPEESFGWDTGLEVTLAKGRAVVDVTWFEADLENKISSNPGAIFGVDPSLINLPGVSNRQGLEVSARVQVTSAFDIGAAYTNLDAVDSLGEKEIRRPEHAGRVDANYKFAGGRGNLHAAVVYNGEQDDLPFMPVFPFERLRVTLDDYLLVNFAASYEVRQGVEVFGRVENLFDEEYEEVYGYGTAPIAAYGGVRITLGGEEGVR